MRVKCVSLPINSFWSHLNLSISTGGGLGALMLLQSLPETKLRFVTIREIPLAATPSHLHRSQTQTQWSGNSKGLRTPSHYIVPRPRRNGLEIRRGCAHPHIMAVETLIILINGLCMTGEKVCVCDYNPLLK